MNNKKYSFVCRLPERPVMIHEHNTKEAAEAELVILKKYYGSSLDECSGIVEDIKYTVEDIFIKLLESNPVEDPKILWKRAQASFDIMSAK